MRTYRKISSLVLFCTALFFAAGCGHHLIPGHFQPEEVGEQQATGEGTNMKVLDDGTVTFVQNRLEVSVRPMTDEEIHRQYPAQSSNAHGPADELPSNPFTYGNWIDARTGRAPQRLSIFKINIKNYEYPKVKFDPLTVTIEAANGRSYYPWGDYDAEEYFRRYPLAFNGLGYLRYKERRDLYTQGKYPDDEFCFSGQEVEGYVVFSKIHDDVSAITVRIPEFGLRYNYRNEPVETVDLSFRFKRDIQKVKNFDEIAVK